MNKILLSLLFLCMSAACKKDNSEPQLPPPTQEGKNVLACRVNGHVHIYSGISNTFNPNGVNYSPYYNKLQLFASNSDYNDFMEIILPINADSVQTGVKYFFTKNELINPFANYYIGNGSIVYKTGTQSGFIQFTKKDKNIAAGIFEFTAYYGSDSVKITEGRFDITNH